MISRSFYLFSPLVLAAAWSAAAWGCTATGSQRDFNDEPTGTTGGAGGQGGHASTSSGDGGGFINFDGGSDAPSQNDAACAATSSEAEKIPLDMIVVLDQSGSMSTGQKWDGATKALKSYVNDPSAAGVSVGLVYFPIEDPPDGIDCNYNHYKNLDVPIGVLPANAPALGASMDAHGPTGLTPMYGAMKGALFTATAYQDANPTHKVILVLASDGDPNNCGGVAGNPPNADDIPTIAGLATSALNYNGVKTYVIAIAGSTIANLDKIAAAGGTGAALDVTANINLFLDKMKEIQAAALPCDFKIPPPPMGEVFDKDLVQVIYTPGAPPGSAGQQIPHADNLQDCGQQPGWYYDNNVKPTKIVLCPKSCQTVKADLEAKVDVAFGCAPDLN